MKTLEKPTSAPVAGAVRADSVMPRVNLHQDAEGYTLDVEMPGVPRDGVEMTVEDGRLILVGHRSRLASAGRLVHEESAAGDYRRVFDLDPGIDAARIEARIEQGLLEVRLPKAEAIKPRRIAVG